MKVDLVVSCQNHISRSRSSVVPYTSRPSPSTDDDGSPVWGEARLLVYRKGMRLRGGFGSCNGRFA